MHRRAGEDRGQENENIGLQEGHEQLQHQGEQHQADRDRGHAEADYRAERAEDEDEADEGHDDDMAGYHIGEKTDAEREGLGDHADQLDGEKKRVEPAGHAFRHDMAEVADDALLPDSGEVDQHEGGEREAGGNGQVPGGGGPERNQAYQVQGQDKEEQGGEIAHVPVALMAQVGVHNFVAQEEHDDLDDGAERGQRFGAAADQQGQADQHDEGGYAHHQQMF